MRPSPRTPSVLPKTSTPRKRERCHSPFLTEKHACGMLRERAIIRLMVCSAAEIMLPSGAFMTMVPFAVAASTSMLSTPTPARPMTFRFDASIMSYVITTANSVHKLQRMPSMKDKPTVVLLEDVRIEDVPSVGGKGASLGEMINAEIPVPRGFAVTAQAFRRFLDETGIAKQLFATLQVNVDDAKELAAAAEKAKKLILATKMPQRMRNDIIAAYKELGKREGVEPLVAVRSSATAEDMPEASFAGQQETFLNVKGANNVVVAVQKCWASLYGARAIFYRIKQGFDHESVNISAVVQKMVNSEKSGVMFTSNPTTGAPEAIIESSWGLGEAIVSGSVSPDTYTIDRKTRNIKANVATKKIMVVKDQKTGDTTTKDVPADMQNKRVLSDSELKTILDLGELIEEHYESPQDIEWAIENGEVFIVQSVSLIHISEPTGRTPISYAVFCLK